MDKDMKGCHEVNSNCYLKSIDYLVNLVSPSFRVNMFRSKGIMNEVIFLFTKSHCSL